MFHFGRYALNILANQFEDFDLIISFVYDKNILHF